MPGFPGDVGRVRFPRDGITRGDVLDYYRRVGPAVLPHLAGRAFVLRRAPEGIDGPAFFEKDLPAFAPAWIARAEVPAATRAGTARPAMTVPVVESLEALLWVVHIGCIDLHVTLARAAAPDRPDQVLFDLDPTGELPFRAVERVALHVRDALAGVGLAAHAKTSGRSGMHVVAPIAATVGYDLTRRFARTVAQAVERAYPGEASSGFAARRRRGVFVDWRQNHVGASIATAYSVRPVDGAPVSCPLAWDEVEAGVDPRRLTMAAVLERVGRLGDLSAPALAGGPDLRALVGRP